MAQQQLLRFRNARMCQTRVIRPRKAGGRKTNWQAGKCSQYHSRQRPKPLTWLHQCFIVWLSTTIHPLARLEKAAHTPGSHRVSKGALFATLPFIPRHTGAATSFPTAPCLPKQPSLLHSCSTSFFDHLVKGFTSP